MNYINNIPDKIVVEDIKNYNYNNNYHHLFYDILRGKAIYPNIMKNENLIYLYTGGNYIKIAYNIQEKNYILYTITGDINFSDDLVIDFKTKSWNNMYQYVIDFFQ